MMIMKTLKIFSLLIVLVMMPAFIAASQLVDRIVAVVDEEIILLSELEQTLQIELLQRGMRVPNNPDELSEMRRALLKRMIDDRIVLAKAKKDSIVVSDREVDEMVKQQIDAMKREYGETTYREELERQNLSEKDLRDKLREQIRQQFLKDEEMRRLTQAATISHREIEGFRNVYADTLPSIISLSHILIRPDTMAVRRRAEEVLHHLMAGEDFEDLARRFSDDPGTANRGGDLGFFGRKTMVAEFDSVAFSLDPGQVSDLVKTEFGYHIIKVEEKREHEVRARHILITFTMAEEEEKEAVELLENLRTRAVNGEDFGQLARQYSQDREFADENGFLNFFPRDETPSPFQATIHGMKLGEISHPFRSPLGMHIIRLNNDQVYIENILRRQKLSEALAKLIEEEKKRIYIDVRL
ncbi:MAG: peptidylprolyl isomerase [Candidatus Latescibacteria bacterium]|nr:peptidylprolyl isomerase [Candidatus Latescibacterota bacterium]